MSESDRPLLMTICNDKIYENVYAVRIFLALFLFWRTYPKMKGFATPGLPKTCSHLYRKNKKQKTKNKKIQKNKKYKRKTSTCSLSPSLDQLVGSSAQMRIWMTCSSSRVKSQDSRLKTPSLISRYTVGVVSFKEVPSYPVSFKVDLNLPGLSKFFLHIVWSKLS